MDKQDQEKHLPWLEEPAAIKTEVLYLELSATSSINANLEAETSRSISAIFKSISQLATTYLQSKMSQKNWKTFRK